MVNTSEKWGIDPALTETVLRRVHWISTSGLTEILMAIRAHHREEERLAEQLRARSQGLPPAASGESPPTAVASQCSSSSPSDEADGPLGLLSEAEAEALMAKSMGSG